MARKKNLSGVAVTDHNTIKGGMKTSKLNNSDTFMVIIGSEINTNMGDLIGIFLNEEIKKKDFFEVCDEIAGQGGIRILPHPYLTFQEIDDEIINSVDIIETFNSRVKNKEINKRAMDLALKKGIPTCGGSDAHFPWQIGSGRTIIEGNITSEEEVRKKLLKGNVIIEGKEIPFISYFFYRNFAGKIIKRIKFSNIGGVK